MALGSSRSNVLGIKEETTEGTLIDLGATTDYVTLQPDVSLTPSFESLSNDEIRASIGSAKPIQGLESPELTFSHYLKGSGVEGTAPEISEVLESGFGSQTANGTERATTSSSTVSLVKLAAGGTDFARGFAMLIKDGTNGYSIRNVLSMATNDATLAFNLANAPASGVSVGKCINYSPTNSGHPSFSAWLYRGNGHAVEAIAGAQTTQIGFNVNAGQLINANFTAQGTKYFFNPIRIASADAYLDFLDNATTRAASVSVKVYRDPYELATALQDSMNSLGSANTFTVTYSSTTGKFTLVSNGTTFSLLWNTGTNTANTIGDKIGFSVAADDTGALTYTSDNAQTYAAPHTPSYDSADPIAAKYLEILLGDSTDTTCFCAQTVDFSMAITKSNVLCICAESGVQQKLATARQVTMTITALLDKYEAKMFQRFRANSEVQCAFNFGPRSGGNWVAGQCGNVFLPDAVVSSFELTDLDSVIGLTLELTAFVDSSGNGEVYLNFL